MLNLRDSEGITLQSIFTSRTVLLSLEGCGIELNSIFEVLTNNSQNLKNLRSINVSNNLCTKSFSKRVIFPELLNTIYAGGVQWRSYNMKPFFEILFSNFKRGLNLSFTHTNGQQGDWEQLNDLFSVTKFSNLLSLDWSGNPVSNQLISFLGRNKFLSFLNLSECLSDQKSNEITVFNNFIEGAKSMRKLVLKSSLTSPIGASFTAVIQAIARNGMIQYVDLSNSAAKEDAFAAIRKFAEDPGACEYLNFDGLVPTDFKQFADLLQFILDLKAPTIQFEFPDKDLKQFIDAELSYLGYIEYMDKFAQLYDDEPNAQRKMFDEPFVLKIKKHSLFGQFPEYTTEQTISDVMTQRLIPADAVSYQVSSPIAERSPFALREDKEKKNSVVSSPKASKHSSLELKSEHQSQTRKEDEQQAQKAQNNTKQENNTKRRKHRKVVEQKTEQKPHRRLDFETPISVDHEHDTDDDGINRRKNHKHRTPFTLNGDEDFVIDFTKSNPTKQKKHKRTSRSITLDGEEPNNVANNSQQREETTKQRKRKHRVAQTLNGDEDITIDFTVDNTTKHRRHKSTSNRLSNTLQGDELPPKRKKSSENLSKTVQLDDKKKFSNTLQGDELPIKRKKSSEKLSNTLQGDELPIKRKKSSEKLSNTLQGDELLPKRKKSSENLSKTVQLDDKKKISNTLQGDEPVRRKHRSSDKVSNTLQGEEIISKRRRKSERRTYQFDPNDSPTSSAFETYDPLQKRRKHHHTPSPLTAENQERHRQSEINAAMTQPIKRIQLTEKAEKTESARKERHHQRRSQSAKKASEPSSPLSIRKQESVDIMPSRPTRAVEVVNLLKGKPEDLKIEETPAPVSKTEETQRRKKTKRRQEAETLEGDDAPFLFQKEPTVQLNEQRIIYPSEELQTLPYAKEKHRKKSHTLQGISPKKNEEDDNSLKRKHKHHSPAPVLPLAKEENEKEKEQKRTHRKKRKSPIAVDTTSTKDDDSLPNLTSPLPTSSLKKKKRSEPKIDETVSKKSKEAESKNDVNESKESMESKETIETKIETKTESKTESKTEETAENKTESKTESKTETKTESKTEEKEEEKTEKAETKADEEAEYKEEETEEEEAALIVNEKKEENTNETAQKPENPERKRYILPLSSEEEPLFVKTEEPQQEPPKLSETKQKKRRTRVNSSESEPLFIFESRHSLKEKIPSNSVLIQQEPKEQDDEKWDLPPLPAYPVPDDIWDQLDQKFVTEDMIKELKKMPIDMHFHHKPGTIIESSDSDNMVSIAEGK